MDPLTKIIIGVGITIVLGLVIHTIIRSLRRRGYQTRGTSSYGRVVAVRRASRHRDTSTQSILVLIKFRHPNEIEPRQVSIFVDSRKIDHIAPEIQEIGSNVMNLNKVFSRAKEATELRRKMLEQGRSKEEILKAVEALTMDRINAREKTTAKMGMHSDWSALSSQVDLPILIHPTDLDKIMIDYDSISRL